MPESFTTNINQTTAAAKLDGWSIIMIIRMLCKPFVPFFYSIFYPFLPFRNLHLPCCLLFYRRQCQTRNASQGISAICGLL